VTVTTTPGVVTSRAIDIAGFGAIALHAGGIGEVRYRDVSFSKGVVSLDRKAS
jgi:hypothetical protein